MRIQSNAKTAKLAEALMGYHASGLPVPPSGVLAEIINSTKATAETFLYEFRGVGAVVIGPDRVIQSVDFDITDEPRDRMTFTKAESERATAGARELVMFILSETGAVLTSAQLSGKTGRSKVWCASVLADMVTDKLIESPRRGVYCAVGAKSNAASAKQRFLDMVREYDESGDDLPCDAVICMQVGISAKQLKTMIKNLINQEEISRVGPRFFRIGNVWAGENRSRKKAV